MNPLARLLNRRGLSVVRLTPREREAARTRVYTVADAQAIAAIAVAALDASLRPQLEKASADAIAAQSEKLEAQGKADEWRQVAADRAEQVSTKDAELERANARIKELEAQLPKEPDPGKDPVPTATGLQ